MALRSSHGRPVAIDTVGGVVEFARRVHIREMWDRVTVTEVTCEQALAQNPVEIGAHHLAVTRPVLVRQAADPCMR